MSRALRYLQGLLNSEEIREAILQAKKYMDHRSSKENLYSSHLVIRIKGDFHLQP